MEKIYLIPKIHNQFKLEMTIIFTGNRRIMQATKCFQETNSLQSSNGKIEIGNSMND